jgi:UDP-N-acetylglucosamine acyltransferase
MPVNINLYLGRTKIGPGCRLFPGCVIGCPPVGAPDESDLGGCAIGANNNIREHVIIECGLDAEGEGTVIGDDNLLMVGVQVGHDAHIAGRCVFANFTRIEPHARVGRFVQTSGFACINAYVSVGAYTYTTGYAGIDRDAPPYAIVHGAPYRLRNVNVEKLRRCGFDEQTIATLKEAFRLLFPGEGDGANPSRLEQVEREFQNEHVKILAESIRRSLASPTGRAREAAGT